MFPYMYRCKPCHLLMWFTLESCQKRWLSCGFHWKNPYLAWNHCWLLQMKFSLLPSLLCTAVASIEHPITPLSLATYFHHCTSNPAFSFWILSCCETKSAMETLGSRLLLPCSSYRVPLTCTHNCTVVSGAERWTTSLTTLPH